MEAMGRGELSEEDQPSVREICASAQAHTPSGIALRDCPPFSHALPLGGVSHPQKHGV